MGGLFGYPPKIQLLKNVVAFVFYEFKHFKVFHQKVGVGKSFLELISNFFLRFFGREVSVKSFFLLKVKFEHPRKQATAAPQQLGYGVCPTKDGARG